jgi:crotonobetainyl-CoA:carnitine CoA-transferase CaiB-like acyl-CoA transferase
MRPLEGLRILDLTRVVSGPFCTMILGDLGAEVIKIEEPASGDDSRAFGPPFVGGESAYYLSVNRNKRSCCIDLKTEEGRQLIERMLPVCDVLVDNFRPGTLDRLGLDDAVVTRANPALIRCSITGFGDEGPDARRPGYDLIVQGEAGLMDITGPVDGPPTKVGTSIADLVTGLYAVQAILAAVINRTRTGHAMRADVSMLDSMASLLTFNAGMYFATGHSPERRGNAHPSIYPYETFRAADGWINLGIANDKFWQAFCDAIDDGDLARDDRFRLASQRVVNRESLRPIIESIMVARTRAQWLGLLEPAGIPCGSIRTVAEVCEATQLTARGQIATMDHPSAGPVRTVMTPFRFDHQPPAQPVPPPRHGEQTDEIVIGIAGVDPEQCRALRARAVVGAKDARPPAATVPTGPTGRRS